MLLVGLIRVCRRQIMRMVVLMSVFRGCEPHVRARRGRYYHAYGHAYGANSDRELVAMSGVGRRDRSAACALLRSIRRCYTFDSSTSLILSS